MTLARIRSLLYVVARVLGDVKAVRRGTLGKRIVWRAAGRVFGRATKQILL